MKEQKAFIPNTQYFGGEINDLVKEHLEEEDLLCVVNDIATMKF